MKDSSSALSLEGSSKENLLNTMLAAGRTAAAPFQSLRNMYHAGGVPQQPAHAQAPTAPPPQHTEYVALSTQHVFIGDEGGMPMVARVSVCDFHGNSLFDTFVLPTHPVTDFRTVLTGLEQHHLQTGLPFTQVQQRVASLLRGKIVVGHQLWFDFAVLNISHLAIDTRDCALFLPFRTALGAHADEVVPLQTLIWRLMRRRITAGYQHPLENARASIDLFRSHEEEWESIVRTGYWPCALPPAAYAQFFL